MIDKLPKKRLPPELNLGRFKAFQQNRDSPLLRHLGADRDPRWEKCNAPHLASEI